MVCIYAESNQKMQYSLRPSMLEVLGAILLDIDNRQVLQMQVVLLSSADVSSIKRIKAQ